MVKKRYSTHDEVLDYCRRSANPVGRLLLELVGVRHSIPLLYSDKICTALQLTNFLQDVKIDFGKGRIYFPLDELERNSVSVNDFLSVETPESLKKVVRENIELVRNMFLEGRNLIPYLSGRFKFEIKWTVAGGERILSKIEKSGFNVLTNRLKLDKLDFIIIFFKSLLSV